MTNKFENLFRWAAHKIKLQEKFNCNNLVNTKIPRKAIYGCFLGENIGFEKGGLQSRPVLVISSDMINNNNGIVIIIPLTTKIKWDTNSTKKKLKYDWHYVLKKSKYNKLKDDSAIQCEEIRSISKSRLGKFICFIDDDDMKNISKRIKKALQT